MSVKKAELQLGFVAVARSTFDMSLARKTIDQARRRLQESGFILKGPTNALATPDEADAVARDLSGEAIDVLLVFQATFADSRMALSLAENVNAPLLFWAVPETPSGNRLRLNSYCGVNLAAHALKRAGLPYESMYLSPDDPSALERIHQLAQASRVQRKLRGTRIGLVGSHPEGFAGCQMDQAALKERLGVEVVQFELDTLFQQVERLRSEEVAELRKSLETRVGGLTELDPTAVELTLASYFVLRRLSEEERLDGFAVRCWPEFFTDLGCAACGGLSLLGDDLVPASCEADVNGVITQLILQGVAQGPVFDSDIVARDDERDGVVFWHCGKAPLSMADPAVKPCATVHSNRRLPLLMEFPLQPGPVTIARLSMATGEYRLVVGRGEMLRGEKSFTGTSGRCRFEKPAKEVMEKILEEGLEHHVALAYGDSLSTLKVLARLLRLPVLEL